MTYHKLKHLEEFAGGLAASITGFAIAETVFWAALSGAVGTLVAFYVKYLLTKLHKHGKEESN